MTDAILPDTRVTRGIRLDEERDGEAQKCSCRAGFRICSVAQELYTEVIDAHREYVRLRRDAQGDGKSMGEAMRAHVRARSAYDRHVYGRGRNG